MRVALVICFLAASCTTPEAGGPMLEYAVGGSAEEVATARAATDGDVLIVGGGSTIYVEQRFACVRCGELILTLEQEGSRIRLLESNVGGICRCLCDYDVEAGISGLEPGVYSVQLWGVEYQDEHALELLGEASIAL